VPILPADLIYKTANGEDRLMSYESLSDGGFATGSLGSEGSLYIMTLCIVRNTWNFRYHHESCGQCSPCREGTGWLESAYVSKTVTDVKKILICFGVFKVKLKETRFVHCDAASWPVAAAIRHFRDEFEYHVRFPEKIKNRNHFVAEPLKSKAFSFKTNSLK
jgi:NADH-quinone oxidoreductase subunit F